MKRLVAALALAAAPAAAETWEFCWQGSGGWEMFGRMEVAEGAPDFIDQTHVTDFYIAGFLDGAPMGSWQLGDRTPRTSWHLRFDRVSGQFPTGGLRPDGADYQAWNAGGSADDCGIPGFGFNAGNNAQDVCVDGQWRTDSMVERETPFPAYRDSLPFDCPAVPLLGSDADAIDRAIRARY